MKRSYPEHWVKVIFSEAIITLESGSRPKGGVKGIIDGIPSIGAEHLNSDGGFNFNNLRFVPIEFSKKMKRGKIEIDDILIVKDGATTGKVSIVNQDFPYQFACVNEHVFICRLNKNLNVRYCFYFLRSQKGQEQILSTFHGGAQGGINSEFVNAVSIPLPPLNEQKRIAEKLDAILPKVKSARARLEKIPAILKKFRQSVLAAACSGKLTEDWREEYTERTGKELPEWEEKKLNEIIYNIKYGYTSKSFSHGEIKYLRITDIQNGKVSWETVPFCQIEKNVIKKYLLEKNDIVFARTGATTGKSFLIKDCPPSVFASYLIRIKPNTNIVSAEYLYFFFQTEYYWLQINENVAGIAQPNCNAQKLSNILIPLPPLEEQHEIVRRVEKLFALADSIEEKYKKAYERLEKLEQAILARTFRGELVEPDPNDEPAEELLKRILEEKAKLEREQKGKKRKK